jgi:nucleotide-binding universal stress UspA family protein
MKIVLGLDTSSASRAVLESVTAKPWPANSYFDVVSVAEPSLLWVTPEIALEAQRRAHQVVADAIARIHATRRDVGGAAISGDPKRVLLERARALGADLVMVGSCEERRRELPFGGVAEAVLRHAPCPVEVVREGRKPKAGGLKILLATDGSTLSEKAAQSIAARPWPEATEVRVLSVLELILPSASALSEVPLLDSGLLASAREQAIGRAQDAIARAREILAPSGLSVSELVIAGTKPDGTERPKTAILSAARTWGADLIVLGARGRGTERFLVGSVAEAVAMHADCSVEIVR